MRALSAIILTSAVPALHAVDARLTFEKDVRPILKAHCTHCHGEEEKPKGGVDLRLRRFMAEIVTPGKPEQSELLSVIRSGEMPEEGKPLSEAQIRLIEAWIAQGAATTRAEPEHLPPGPLITDEDRTYWAFQPIKKPTLPSTKPIARTLHSPVDTFILARLQLEGLTFAPEADARTLIRRITLDLTGLPPTPEEVSAFLADSSPDAYEKVVDRLLHSQAYAERWARHWLDVVGYADSNGYTEADSLRPHAWRYRDYVIRSLNEDKPWDLFLQEQLAGDELAGVTHENYQHAVLNPQLTDQLTATAFLRLAPDGTGDANDDPNLARNNVIAEQLKIIGSSLLGLSVSCAQCHDHRYDPITQKDYYRLRAIFDPAYHWEAWRSPAQRLYSLYTPEQRAQAAAIEKEALAIEAEARAMSKKFLDEIFEVEILKLPEAERGPFRLARATQKDKQTAEQKALIKKYPSALATYSLDLYDKKKQDLVDAKMAEATRKRATKPEEGFLMAQTELRGKVPVSKLFYRGDHDQPKEPLHPGEISILASPQTQDLSSKALPTGSTGRRLSYAKWLTNGKHPLTARVLVNRFWHHHFGRGLVPTLSDFGRQGQLPSHPDLLDYLAHHFVSSGWRLKDLHRLLVLSTTYRQSCDHPTSLSRDPENRLLARFRLQRLDAEALRDSLLAISDSLVKTPYGPPSGIGRDPAGRIIPGLDKGTITLNKVDPAGAADFRRSLYIQARRTRPLTVLETFDAPTMTPNCDLRSQSTVAPQSLLLMNDSFMLENSLRLARKLERAHPKNLSAQIHLLWSLLYSQPASASDATACQTYLQEQTTALQAYHHDIQHPKGVVPNPPEEALASLCQVLCSSNRFLYIE